MNMPRPSSALITALVLSLGAAVSLGLSRFSYALLLPPMRSDLQWSYFTAGLINAVNAAGYLVGAWWATGCLQRWGARRTLLWAGAASALLLVLHGTTACVGALALLRATTGVASALMFVAGGVLAASLSTETLPSQDGETGSATPPVNAGLVLGLYYGGVGLGILACATVLPAVIDGPDMAHAWAGKWGWQRGWWVLGVLAAVACTLLAWRLRQWPDAMESTSVREAFPMRKFAFGLAAYFMFGLGYIGYMTFIITFLREQQLDAQVVIVFYALLGVGVMGSPWLWAGHLQRNRGGQTLSVLCALLALATAIPVWASHPAWAFVSGGLFGAVFLSVVASTTALVRHNVPATQWAGGISAFTLVFALGQILGPGLVGWLADGGGLHAGLGVSAAALAVGALLARHQKPLHDS